MRTERIFRLQIMILHFQMPGFGGHGRTILKGVSFRIPEHTTTAIVGPSGSGKTTICNLLARFYDVNSGSITVGGHDVREFTCDSLLSNMAMVFQNVYLFQMPSAPISGNRMPPRRR